MAGTCVSQALGLCFINFGFAQIRSRNPEAQGCDFEGTCCMSGKVLMLLSFYLSGDDEFDEYADAGTMGSTMSK